MKKLNKTIPFICPKCGKKTDVIECLYGAVEVTLVNPVMAEDKELNLFSFDWERRTVDCKDAEVTFYRCGSCGEEVAKDIFELEELIKNQPKEVQ